MTLEEKIRDTARQMDEAGLYFGHGTDNAVDEACWLVSAAIGMAPDFGPDVYQQLLSAEQLRAVDDLLQRRIQTRQPLAYLLGHAWLAGLRFDVSSDVLVPRSPLAELILDGFEPWLDGEQLKTAVDVGTGSGCLAIALACHWPGVKVDAVDISDAALALAERNAQQHGVSDRVRCVRSDLLSALEGRQYDLILANPPYVPTASMVDLPDEFLHEPRLGLEAGADGLDLVRRLLVQAPQHLTAHGILICEVGEAAEALDTWLSPHVDLVWLEFQYGGDGVFLLDKAACERVAASVAG